MGTASLVDGTIGISTTAVQTGDLIFVSKATKAGTTVGILHAETIVNATSFVINSYDLSGSLSADDDSVVNWWIVDPTP